MPRLFVGRGKFYRKAHNPQKLPCSLNTLNSLIMCYKDYGLLASVNRGLLPIICDAGMRGLAEELNPNGFNEFCTWHTFQRIGLRAHQDCLEIFDPDQPDKLKKIMKFCQKAGKDMSKKDMKKMIMRMMKITSNNKLRTLILII